MSFSDFSDTLSVIDRFLLTKKRSVVVGHVNPTDWLFDRWGFQTLRYHAAIYDLARDPFEDRASQYIARPRDVGHPGSRWHFPLALLLLRFHRLRLLQSVLSALETGACAVILVHYYF